MLSLKTRKIRLQIFDSFFNMNIKLKQVNLKSTAETIGLHLVLNVHRVMENHGVTENANGRLQHVCLKVSTVEIIVLHLVLNALRVMGHHGATENANGRPRHAFLRVTFPNNI